MQKTHLGSSKTVPALSQSYTPSILLDHAYIAHPMSSMVLVSMDLQLAECSSLVYMMGTRHLRRSRVAFLDLAVPETS